MIRPSEFFASVPPNENTVHSSQGNTFTPPWKRRKTTGAVNPRAAVRMPSVTHVAQDWVSSWGPISYVNEPNREYLQPDIRTYVFPAGFGMGWSGRQQLNGVSQLDTRYVVPKRVQYKDKHGKVVSGASPLPYWQASHAAANPQQYNRFGGQAGEVPGPIQTNQWQTANYAGVPQTGGGPGTVSILSRFKQRYGF
jgi:hypothetical protein